MARILVIEDQEDLLKGLEINLRQEGYEVIKALRGDTGLNLAISHSPDLIVLDIMLPGMNGLDVCRGLRQRGVETPIIMLTAKGEELDRVLGLEMGADDYVTKPFGIRELIARIRAGLRRRLLTGNTTVTTCTFGDVEADFEKMQVRKQGLPIDLTARECNILKLLVQHRGEVVSRELILREVWGYQFAPTTRTIDTHIVRLRQKLERDPARPVFILTIYGEGYKFVD
jgi:DNA-binding response OmpR family regulator